MHARTHLYKINTMSFITQKENITLSTFLKPFYADLFFVIPMQKAF